MNYSRKPASVRACFLPMIALVGALGFTGCSRESIEVYSVPKTEEFVPQQHASAAPQAPQSSFMPDDVTWELPAGWAEGGSPRMGEKTFHIDLPDGSHLDASLIPFPSMRGKEAMVVNIWRGQMQLDPVSEAEVEQVAIPVRVGAANAKMFDLVNPNSTSALGERTMVAMHHQGMSTWFFKLNGSSAAVEAAKPSFLEFLGSVGFKPGSHPPIGGGMAAAPSAPAGAGSADLPGWTVPEGWVAQAAGRMLLATFEATNEAGSALVTVSSFPGTVGGLIANVNRWRGQLGLTTVDSEEALGEQVIPLESIGGSARLISLDNAGQGMLTVMFASADGHTWFYKITGASDVLELEKSKLIGFVQSAGHEVR